MKFPARTRKSGGSIIITIPSAIELELGKVYEFEVTKRGEDVEDN